MRRAAGRLREEPGALKYQKQDISYSLSCRELEFSEIKDTVAWRQTIKSR
jgi:hypothetical protein